MKPSDAHVTSNLQNFRMAWDIDSREGGAFDGQCFVVTGLK